jgi:hypothetical protein
MELQRGVDNAISDEGEIGFTSSKSAEAARSSPRDKSSTADIS